METLMNILMEIDDSIDWKNESALIDSKILDSFGVISLISEMRPENLNSVNAIWDMVQRLKEN